MGMEVEVDTPRLSTPFYDALKKKYPKAFKRRSSISSQTSENISLYPEINSNSTKEESDLSYKDNKRLKPQELKNRRPPLPPRHSKRHDKPCTEKLTPGSSIENGSHSNVNLSKDVFQAIDVIDRPTLCYSKKSGHYNSLSSIHSEPDGLNWQKSNLKKASYFYSTLSLKGDCISDLIGTDSVNTLKEKLRKNQESWKKLLAFDNSPFKIHRSSMCSNGSYIEDLPNNHNRTRLIQTEIKENLCHYTIDFPPNKQHSVTYKTLKALAEVQSKITSQYTIAKKRYLQPLCNDQDLRNSLRENINQTCLSQSSSVNTAVETLNETNISKHSVNCNGQICESGNPNRCELLIGKDDNVSKKAMHKPKVIKSDRLCGDNTIDVSRLPVIQNLEQHGHESSVAEKSKKKASQSDRNVNITIPKDSDVDSGIDGCLLKHTYEFATFKNQDVMKDVDITPNFCTTQSSKLSKLRSRQRSRERNNQSIKRKSSPPNLLSRSVSVEDLHHHQSNEVTKDKVKGVPKLQSKQRSASSDSRSRVIFQDEISISRQNSETNNSRKISLVHETSARSICKIEPISNIHGETSAKKLLSVAPATIEEENKARSPSNSNLHGSTDQVLKDTEECCKKATCESIGVRLPAKHLAQEVTECERKYMVTRNTRYDTSKKGISLKNELSESRSSLLSSFKDTAQKKIGKLRRALSLEGLSREDTQSKSGLYQSKLDGKLSQTSSLRSLFLNNQKKGQYEIESNSARRSHEVHMHTIPLQRDTVEEPRHYRKLGKIKKINSDGTHIIELMKPQNGPFGFYIARGNSRYNYGVFITRLGDGLPGHFFAGLLGIGDEILQINYITIKEMKLDDIYKLLNEKEKLTLTVLPFTSRKE